MTLLKLDDRQKAVILFALRLLKSNLGDELNEMMADSTGKAATEQEIEVMEKALEATL